MDLLLEEAMGQLPYMVEIRRQIHENPEEGMELPKTLALVTQELREMGLRPEPCGKAGVTALIEGEGPGGVFLLRADMDALPVEEETGLAFAAQNGSMHACGHDCHAAMLLGAAKLLQKHKSEFRGTVKLMFQPGEEIMEGAKDMIAAGVLENPKVDAAMMVHINSGFECQNGAAAVFGPGVNYASVDWFRIDIQGLGGHGAQPEKTVSPLPIVAAICGHLQEMIASGVANEESAVLTLGEVHAGKVANVIPDTAYMAGTIRTFNEEVRAQLKKGLERAIPLLAQAKGGSAEVRFGANAPPIVSSARVRGSVLSSIRSLLGEELALDLETAFEGKLNRVSSSEDFAYVAKEVPAAVVWLMAGTPEDGYCYPCHHPKADFDESVFYEGAAVYAQCAMDWLNETFTGGVPRTGF